MVNHKSYPMYKESEIDWIGKAPENWKKVSIKHCFKVKNGREILDEEEDRPKEIVVYGSGGVFKKTSSYLHDGDSVLFGRKGTIGKPLFVSNKFWTVDTMYYTEFSRNMSPKYFYYLMIIYPWDLITTKTALPSVVGSDVENTLISIPEFNEQLDIAAFLDQQTTEIDSLITDKEKLITLLEEKRQAVITEAVINGLNPDVEMKDSSVEWIGEIPEHWDEKKIKYLFYETNDLNLEDDAELLSLFTSIGVRPRKEMEQKGNKSQTVINYKKVKKGDIVVNKLLAWMGSIGISDYEGVTSPAYDVYRALNANLISNKYYHYYFRGHYFKGDCHKLGRGIMMMRWRTYPEQFKTINVPMPPLSEQVEIANYLDRKTLDIEQLVFELKDTIERLREYRQSIIYEAVTGKIDVREYGEISE